jgi:hypothetical protein
VIEKDKFQPSSLGRRQYSGTILFAKETDKEINFKNSVDIKVEITNKNFGLDLIYDISEIYDDSEQITINK